MNDFKKTTSGIGYAIGAALAAGWVGHRILNARRMLDLTGRTVLITGGSRGLGLALAREFARKQARVALVARNTEELNDAQRDVMQLGVDVATFQCDLREPEQISRMIEQVEAEFGPISILVNNAGTIIVGPMESLTAADFQEAMDVNFWGAALTTLELLPRLRQRGGGRIVNVASIGGKMPVPHLAAYCASKFALVGFSSTCRAELVKDNILVTTINPGLMRTGSPRHAQFKGKHRAEYAWFSIGDALPGLTLSARSAARRIVLATMRGEAEVNLGWPAKLASRFYGLAPSTAIELNTLLNQMLPAPPPSTTQTLPGYASESAITRSFVRFLGHKAEREFNQLHA